MNLPEMRQTAEKWAEDGIDIGASHLIVIYDVLNSEYRPLLVFPEQDVELEVVKILFHSNNEYMLMAVLLLSNDVNSQLSESLKPLHMVVSRVEN